MYYSIIDAASLSNPTILNKFKQHNITVQYEPQSPTSKYHYIFLLQFPEKTIIKSIKMIQRKMMPSWYAFFWNENVLYVVFFNNYFKIELPAKWDSDIVKEAITCGRLQDIPDVYLDFSKEFIPYQAKVKELLKKSK